MTASSGTAGTPHPLGREALWRELLGEQLRTARVERGRTLRAVAGRANISMQYLSEIERGRKEPSSEILAAVVEALGLTLLDLAVAVAGRLQQSQGTSSGQRAVFTLAA